MYLSIKQHDLFRTILMGFEIPYRSYIADILISSYPSEGLFEHALTAKKASLRLSDPFFYGKHFLLHVNIKKSRKYTIPFVRQDQ